jgi:hypothetical protein
MEMIKVTWYEIHWARSNRCDEIAAMRTGARRHERRSEAEAEAVTLRSGPRDSLGTVVPIVVEVRGEVRS